MAKTPKTPKFEDKTIERMTASNRAAARAMAIDAQRRSAAAKASNPAFTNPVHVDTVDEVKRLVGTFFTVHNGMYVNHRDNRGKPFTVIKLDNVSWPQNERGLPKNFNKLRSALTSMKVEVVNSNLSNSMLFRITA